MILVNHDVSTVHSWSSNNEDRNSLITADHLATYCDTQAVS